MGVLYIAGSSPGVGSTAVCAALATTWQRAGKRVALFKPLELSGETPGADSRLFSTIAPNAGTDTREFEGGALDPALGDSIAVQLEELAREADVVIVEGLPLTDAQGSRVSATGALAQGVAQRTGSRVVGVLPYAPGLDAGAVAPWQEAFGDGLAGVLINRCTRYAGHDAADRLTPAIQEAGARVLGTVPEDRAMLAPTVRQVADHLSAELLTWASEDQRLVEQFIIGGLILEWGGNYFGRYPNQAVIVRGGRMDIAMSALNFPMSCLVLTACSEPPQYVHQRADEQEVPLLVAQQGTLEAAAALETIHQRTSVHHVAKVDRLAGLLEGVVDWDAANAAAGLR